jgi:tetratricopeptide (TPR) repeat protein
MTTFSQQFDSGRRSQQAGNHADAERAFRQAVKLCPGHAEAWYRLGQACAAQGRAADAAAAYREALRLRPDVALTHDSLGVALAQQGDLQQAAAHFRQAVQLRPDFAAAHCNLGNVLKEQGESDEALGCYREAIRLRPDLAAAHNNLGVLLADRGQLDEAAPRYREAIRLRPDYADAWYNLGNALRQQGQLHEALSCYDRFLQLCPGSADAHNNRGNVLLRLGHLDAVMGCYEQALRLQPDLPEAHQNRALFWLLHGDFERGWPEYEWRPGGLRRGPWPFAQPWWDGGALGGRTILLHAEQGLGDTLQFVRYAPLVRQRGGTVLLLCQKALRRLLEGAPGVDGLFTPDQPLPAFDVHAPLLSLPRLLGTTATTISAEVPYLRADTELARRWQAELAPLTGCRVGIVWQGSLTHKGDRLRSVPLACFEPLARVPGARLVSLQKGPGSEQAAQAGFDILDMSARLDEESGPFMDTAAVLANLDVLVTIDTAVAHLAGALGVPTWLALSLAPDWRWLLGREDSPWYPTMCLFRQARFGDWDDVFRRLAAALHQRLTRSATDSR